MLLYRLNKKKKFQMEYVHLNYEVIYDVNNQNIKIAL